MFQQILTEKSSLRKSFTRCPLWAITAAVLAAAPFTASAQNPDCTLIVPPNPLTAQGLATPYQLVATNPANGTCSEILKTADGYVQAAFVQAAVIDLITGQISVYHPLVVNKGSTAAVAPVVPQLPFLNVVAIWFGYNGDNLTLTSASPNTLTNNDCHQGMGQFAYCNATAFFLAANAEILTGSLKVPPIGISPKDNRPCPTVRSFTVVDQDQSDNLPTMYLISAGNKTAQYTKANTIALPGYTILSNPSDNRLTDLTLDSALGCTPWTVTDLANPGFPAPALALNELQAAFYQASPVALVPLGSPLTLDPGTGAPNLARVNEYRAGVNQLPAFFSSDASTASYCSHVLTEATAKLVLDRLIFTPIASPKLNEADTLYNFMGNRLFNTYEILKCKSLIGVDNPVTITSRNAQGAVTGVVIH